MSKIFKSLITVAGREKIAEAIVNGDKVFFLKCQWGMAAAVRQNPTTHRLH